MGIQKNDKFILLTHNKHFYINAKYKMNYKMDCAIHFQSINGKTVINKIKVLKNKTFVFLMERMMGIGPTSGAWKALILPLNYIRNELPFSKDNINYTKLKVYVNYFFEKIYFSSMLLKSVEIL